MCSRIRFTLGATIRRRRRLVRSMSNCHAGLSVASNIWSGSTPLYLWPSSGLRPTLHSGLRVPIPHENDRFGQMNLSDVDMAARDRAVLDSGRTGAGRARGGA